MKNNQKTINTKQKEDLASQIGNSLILCLTEVSVIDEIEFIIGKGDNKPELFRNCRDYFISEYSDRVSYFTQIDTELITPNTTSTLRYRERISGSSKTYEKKVTQYTEYFESYNIKLNKKSEFEDKPTSFRRGNTRKKSVVKIYMGLCSIFFSEVETTRFNNAKTSYEIELELNPLLYPVMETKKQQIINNVIFLHSVYNSLSFFNPSTPLIPTVLEIEQNRKTLRDYVIRDVTLRDIESEDIKYGNIIGGKYPYRVGIKNDGTRAYLVCDNVGIWISSSSFNQLKYRWKTSDINDGTITIFDGELMIGCNSPPCVKYKEDNYEYYVIFDCLVSFSRNITGRSMTERLTELVNTEDSDIPKLMTIINDKLSHNNPNGNFINKKSYEPLLYLNQSPQEFNKRDGFFEVIKNSIESNKNQKGLSDGIIFFPDCPYFNIKKSSKNIGIEPAALKWKPLENRTIDLLCKNAGGVPILYATDFSSPDKLRPIYEYSILDKDISHAKYNGLILEFKVEGNSLKYVRKRTYKARPNSYRILSKITSNSITEEDLIGNSIYLVAKQFNRIKRDIFSNMTSKTLLDIGSGRLADLNKWNNFEKVVCVEPNNKSRYDGLKRISRQGIHVICLSAERSILISKAHNFFTFQKRSEASSMMLSMSNFSVTGRTTIKSVCETIGLCCKSGSSLHFLTIDGTKVRSLLREKGDLVEVKGVYTLEYIDENKYKISLPNTIIDYQEEEYYVDVVNYANQLGSKKIEKQTFIDSNNELLLTDTLRTYSNLFSFGMIKGIKTKTVKESSESAPELVGYSSFSSISDCLYELLGIKYGKIDKDRDINQVHKLYNIGVVLAFIYQTKVTPFSHTVPGHKNINIIIVHNQYYASVNDDLIKQLVDKEDYEKSKYSTNYKLVPLKKVLYPHLNIYKYTNRKVVPSSNLFRKMNSQMKRIAYSEFNEIEDYLIWNGSTSFYKLKDMIDLYDNSIKKIIYSHPSLLLEKQYLDNNNLSFEVYSSPKNERNYHKEKFNPNTTNSDLKESIIVSNMKYEKLDERIPLILRLKPNSILSCVEWGQLKLFISEVELLTMFPEQKTVIYVGASPGNHIPFLASLFPEKHFILYDPSPFNLFYGEDDDELDVTNIEIKQEIASPDIFSPNKDSIFISDIRSFDPHEYEGKEFQESLISDLELQRQIARKINPTASLLKFKLPYGEGKTTYFDGEVFLPVWGKKQTTEVRLLVTDHDSTKEYNNVKHEEKMNHFNKIHRYAYHDHPLIGHSGLCPCYDCASQVHILGKYLKAKNITDVKQLIELNEKSIYYCASGTGRTLNNRGKRKRQLTFAEILLKNDYDTTVDWLKNVRIADQNWLKEANKYGQVLRALKEDARFNKK